jgi:hypothetical protein
MCCARDSEEKIFNKPKAYFEVYNFLQKAGQALIYLSCQNNEWNSELISPSFYMKIQPPAL